MADETDISVKLVSADDRADWQRLWRDWQRHIHGNVPEAVTDRTWLKQLDATSGLHALIARNKVGEALGFANASLTPFAWTASDIVFLQNLFVSESARGQGVGTLLLKGVYDLADALGATQVFWLVNERDSSLQDFYARHAIRTPYLRYMRGPWPW